MNVIFRMTRSFVTATRRDLERPHEFAAERVGWITTRAARAGRSLIVLADDYYPVADEDYLDDPRVGAMMGPDAIRKGLNLALLGSVGVFHVHMHEHRGMPGFSRVDLEGQQAFMPDFSTVRPELPHGAIVLSHDSAFGHVWLDEKMVLPIAEFNVTGPRLIVEKPERSGWLGFRA